MIARPFLKWAGGKTRLLDEIMKRAPLWVDDYYEPFLGGGALFFRMRSEGLIGCRATLSDCNADLIRTYRVVRDDVEDLIAELESMAECNSREFFLNIRAEKIVQSDRLAASRFIYLNKTAFNGLYRVSRSGKFNVPYGEYKHPKICDAENLRACSKALQGVEIECCDFEKKMMGARGGSFFYLDPPYPPSSKTSSFTAYSKDGFSWDDHVRLRHAAKYLRSTRGCHVVVSNADLPMVEGLYAGFDIYRVSVNRSVGASAETRKKVSELLIVG